MIAVTCVRADAGRTPGVKPAPDDSINHFSGRHLLRNPRFQIELYQTEFNSVYASVHKDHHKLVFQSCMNSYYVFSWLNIKK